MCSSDLQTVTAMKARDAERTGTLRLIKAALMNKALERNAELTPAEEQQTLTMMIKQRRDSIEQFTAAGRKDLADKEAAELELLRQYLPQQLSQEQVASAIEAAILAAGASGPQAMGKVMAALKTELAGRADMARVSALVKARLGS